MITITSPWVRNRRENVLISRFAMKQIIIQKVHFQFSGIDICPHYQVPDNIDQIVRYEQQ